VILLIVALAIDEMKKKSRKLHRNSPLAGVFVVAAVAAAACSVHNRKKSWMGLQNKERSGHSPPRPESSGVRSRAVHPLSDQFEGYQNAGSLRLRLPWMGRKTFVFVCQDVLYFECTGEET